MFQHAQANKSASLRSIFTAMSDDWFSTKVGGIPVEIMYAGWGGWFIRSYEEDSYGRQYTVVRSEARSYSALLRSIKTFAKVYTMPLHNGNQFLIGKFGAFHSYNVDPQGRWIKDIA